MIHDLPCLRPTDVLAISWSIVLLVYRSVILAPRSCGTGGGASLLEGDTGRASNNDTATFMEKNQNIINSLQTTEQFRFNLFHVDFIS